MDHPEMEPQEYSYLHHAAPDPTFADLVDPGIDSYTHALSPWTPASSGPPVSYFDVGEMTGYQAPTLFERRRNPNENANISCPDPNVMQSSHYQVPPTPFETPHWSPDITVVSGLGGTDGSMEYFNSPLGTLSFADSTSASPVGATPDWSASMLVMGPPYGNSSGSISTGGVSYGESLDDGSFYPPGPFGAIQNLPAAETDYRRADGSFQDAKPKLQPPKPQPPKLQPRPSEDANPRSSYRKDLPTSSKTKVPSSNRKDKKKAQPHRGSEQTSAQAPKLRTAARRRSEETGHRPKPGESPEDQRIRTNHNKVEKEYRSRLNREFELVIDVLPADQVNRGKSSRGKISKSQVLASATITIHSLAEEVAQLQEKKRLMEEEKKKMLLLEGKHEQ